MKQFNFSNISISTRFQKSDNAFEGMKGLRKKLNAFMKESVQFLSQLSKDEIKSWEIQDAQIEEESESKSLIHILGILGDYERLKRIDDPQLSCEEAFPNIIDWLKILLRNNDHATSFGPNGVKIVLDCFHSILRNILKMAEAEIRAKEILKQSHLAKLMTFTSLTDSRQIVVFNLNRINLFLGYTEDIVMRLKLKKLFSYVMKKSSLQVQILTKLCAVLCNLCCKDETIAMPILKSVELPLKFLLVFCHGNCDLMYEVMGVTRNLGKNFTKNFKNPEDLNIMFFVLCKHMEKHLQGKKPMKFDSLIPKEIGEINNVPKTIPIPKSPILSLIGNLFNSSKKSPTQEQEEQTAIDGKYDSNEDKEFDEEFLRGIKENSVEIFKADHMTVVCELLSAIYSLSQENRVSDILADERHGFIDTIFRVFYLCRNEVKPLYALFTIIATLLSKQTPPLSLIDRFIQLYIQFSESLFLIFEGYPADYFTRNISEKNENEIPPKNYAFFDTTPKEQLREDYSELSALTQACLLAVYRVLEHRIARNKFCLIDSGKAIFLLLELYFKYFKSEQTRSFGIVILYSVVCDNDGFEDSHAAVRILKDRVADLVDFQKNEGIDESSGLLEFFKLVITQIEES